MAVELGKAYVQIIPSAKGIKSNIENELSGGGGLEAVGTSAGKKLGGALVGGLKTLFAASAIGTVAIVKEAISAGADLQQSFGGLETIYGDAADSAKEYAMQAAAAGISANDFAEQAVSFGAALKQAYGGDTTQAMDAANQAIMDMADNSAKMGTDISSVQAAYQGFARQNYTMLDSLKLGYGGTKEEMQRLLEDAEKLSGVHYDIENLGDVYSAIHVIQEDLGLTGVAAEEAKSTFSGSLNAMKASWTNVMAALTTGEGLDTAISNMSESIKNFAENVLAMLGQIAPQIPSFIMGLVDTIIDNAPALIESGLQIMIQLAAGLIKAIPRVIEKIPEIFRSIKDAFASIDWATLGRQVINGIVNGIAAFGHLIWDHLSGLLNNALAWAKNLLGIQSPSKVFRDEIGEMIPAGMALGIEAGEDPLNSTIAGTVDGMVNEFDRAGRAGMNPVAYDAGGGIDYNRLAQALSNRPIQIVGDTSKIFKVVKNSNETRTRATGYNALSMAR